MCRCISITWPGAFRIPFCLCYAPQTPRHTLIRYLASHSDGEESWSNDWWRLVCTKEVLMNRAFLHFCSLRKNRGNYSVLCLLTTCWYNTNTCKIGGSLYEYHKRNVMLWVLPINCYFVHTYIRIHIYKIQVLSTIKNEWGYGPREFHVINLTNFIDVFIVCSSTNTYIGNTLNGGYVFIVYTFQSF